jgi:hypothetical protein
VALVIFDDDVLLPGVPGGQGASSFQIDNGLPRIIVDDDIDVSGGWGYSSAPLTNAQPSFPPSLSFDDTNGVITVCVNDFNDMLDCATIQRSTDQVAWTTIRGGACAVPPTSGLVMPNGVVGANATTPDDPSLDITGDIDLRADLTLPSWLSGGFNHMLVGKWTGPNNQSYLLWIDSGGSNLRINWSADGTNGLVAVSTVPVPVPASGRQAVRATLDVDNGAAGRTATFYTAPTINGPWTQLGAQVVQGGVTSIFSSSAVMEVGSLNNGTTDPGNGVIHAVEVRQGIDGVIVANPIFWRDAPTGATFFTDTSGHTWTLNGGTTIQHYEVCLNDYEFTPCVPNYYRRIFNPAGLYLPGVAGSYAVTPDVSALDVVGDIDIRVDVTLNSWKPGTEQVLVSKWTNTGPQFSYIFDVIPTTGRLIFAWSANGTVTNSATSTVAPTVSDGNRLAVRVTFDVDNGAAGRTATFYTAPTIAGPWTQLGAPVVSAGVTSIFNSTTPVEIGTSSGGTGSPTTGIIHTAQILNGINGTPVMNVDFGAQAEGVTSFTDYAGRVWSILNNPGVLSPLARIYSTQTTSVITPQLTKVWFKSVTHPFLNIAMPSACDPIGLNPIEMLEPLSRVSRAPRTGIFPIVNRTYPIAVNDLRLGRAWSIALRTWTAAALKQIDFLLASGDVILIQTPCVGCAETVESGYVVALDAGYVRHHRYRQRAIWDIDVQEIAAPGPDIVYAQGTWQSVINQYGSWSAVLAAFPSWQALLAILPQASEVIVP